MSVSISANILIYTLLHCKCKCYGTRLMPQCRVANSYYHIIAAVNLLPNNQATYVIQAIIQFFCYYIYAL